MWEKHRISLGWIQVLGYWCVISVFRKQGHLSGFLFLRTFLPFYQTEIRVLWPKDIDWALMFLP